EQERVRWRTELLKPQPPADDRALAVLEWTLETLASSARWRIGDTLVSTARHLLGLGSTAQITDYLREIVQTRKLQNQCLAEQANALADPVNANAERIAAAFHQLYYGSAAQTWQQTTWL